MRLLLALAFCLLLTAPAYAIRICGIGTPTTQQRHKFAHRFNGHRIAWIRLPAKAN